MKGGKGERLWIKCLGWDFSWEKYDTCLPFSETSHELCGCFSLPASQLKYIWHWLPFKNTWMYVWETKEEGVSSIFATVTPLCKLPKHFLNGVKFNQWFVVWQRMPPKWKWKNTHPPQCIHACLLSVCFDTSGLQTWALIQSNTEYSYQKAYSLTSMERNMQKEALWMWSQ